MYGPTTGDILRLADTDLYIRVEKDYTIYGDEYVSIYYSSYYCFDVVMVISMWNIIFIDVSLVVERSLERVWVKPLGFQNRCNLIQ